MGKYDDVPTNNPALCKIANELVEANRLKIIELKIKFYASGKKISLDELEGTTKQTKCDPS